VLLEAFSLLGLVSLARLASVALLAVLVLAIEAWTGLAKARLVARVAGWAQVLVTAVRWISRAS